MVDQSEEKTTKKMWKIEGEAFEKVKAAKAEVRKAKEEAKRMAEEAHKKFWDTIHDALPEVPREGNYRLNTDCESLGLYALQEQEGCDHSDGILGALLAAAKSS